MRRQSKSTLIALGGICTALSVVLMLISSIIPLATYIAPMISGLALLPLKEEMGRKNALIAFTACSLLCLFIVPEKECVMLFIFLLGWYPIMGDLFLKIKSRLLRIIAKLAVFNVSVVLGYFVLIKLFSMGYIMEEFGGVVLLSITLIMGNVAFLVYDIALMLFKKIYYMRIRKLFGIK